MTLEVCVKERFWAVMLYAKSYLYVLDFECHALANNVFIIFKSLKGSYGGS